MDNPFAKKEEVSPLASTAGLFDKPVINQAGVNNLGLVNTEGLFSEPEPNSTDLLAQKIATAKIVPVTDISPELIEAQVTGQTDVEIKLAQLHDELEVLRAGRTEDQIPVRTQRPDPYWAKRNELQQYLHSLKAE